MTKTILSILRSHTRIGLLLCVIILRTIVQAQETGWAVVKHNADPMLGVKAYTSYTYKGENGDCFTFWDMYQDRYKLYSTRVFKFDYDGSVLVKVGLYDHNSNLLETFQMYLYVVRDGKYNQIETHVRGPLTTPIGQKDKVRKIINHIINGRGFVRFVAPIYAGEDLDLRALTISTYAEMLAADSVPQEQSDSTEVIIE